MNLLRFGRRVVRFFPRGMSGQLALALIGLVVIPLVLLGSSLLVASREAVRETLFRDYEHIAVRAASQIGQMVEEPMNLLASTSSILAMLPEDAWNQETVLVELALNHPYFEKLAVLGPDRLQIASSEMGAAEESGGPDPEWIQIASGDARMSRVQVSETLSPYMHLGVPLIRDGRRVGVLTAVVSMKRLWTLVDAIRIGNTGAAYVTDERGVLIAHPDKKKILLQDEFGKTTSSGVQAGLSGVTVEHVPGDGQWIRGYAGVPRLGWSVVVQQDAREAFWHLNRMQTMVLLLIATAVIAAGAAGVLLAQRVVRPVKRLSQSLLRVSRGHLDERLPVRRSDEIGRLALMYNRTVSKLRKARDNERLATVGRALTAIVHELKNSLVLVNTYVALLPRRGHDRPFLDRMADVLPRELEAWKNMLQDVAEYSKKIDYNLEPTSLGLVLDETIVLMAPRFEERSLVLKYEPTVDLPIVLGNRQKLRQAVINLVLNAMDFSPNGGTVRVMINRPETAGSPSDTIHIVIHDEGPGIPADLLSKIFDPFFSTKTNSLGLGLAISRDIVQRHGGRLEASNIDGGGASFMLVLPLSASLESSGRLADRSGAMS